MQTERRVVVDQYHGIEVLDPYRWLEGSAAPETNGDAAELDREVSEWTDRQNARTRAFLDVLPGRDRLVEELRPLLQIGGVESLSIAGDRIFHAERKGDEAQAVVYVREGSAGEPRPVLNVNELDPEGLLTTAWYTPSRDGRLLAFGLYRAGDEKAVLHVLDVDTGEGLPDVIPGKVAGCSWLPDGSGFVYRALGDVNDPYSGVIRVHRLGSDPAADATIADQRRDWPGSTTWGPFPIVDRAGKWLVLVYYTGTDSNDVWAIDLARFLATGEAERREILVGEKALSEGIVEGDVLYLKTTFGAPQGRLAAVDLSRPEREHWREIVPERADAVLTDVALANGHLLLDWLKDASSRIELLPAGGGAPREIPLPAVGTAGVVGDPDRARAYLFFESFHVPRSIYEIDLADPEPRLWARPEIPVDPSEIETEQVFFPSRDGTRIPMFLVRRAGFTPNGGAPVLLSGYGGFNISRTPAFLATIFPWIRRGGVYALANLRGGGEYGEDWHRAGMRERKQNVFDDFFAAADWLVARGIADPNRLAAHGGSNGGLLMGAAITQAPEKFRAVVCSVPLLDMLRYQHFLMARYWVPEYGSAEVEEEFRWLAAYSPYHRVEDGRRYPAVLFTAGEHDTRVHACHARKMAARMQAAAADQEERPVLLWVDRESGHGPGKPLAIRVRESADFWGFLASQLGM